ncbi:MAG: DciA family protein [Pseudomonadota bacterium]
MTTQKRAIRPKRRAVPTPKRRGRPHSVARLTPKIMRPSLARFGMGGADLLTEWEAIVGPQLAKLTLPLRLKRARRQAAAEADAAQSADATLVLRASGAAATQIGHEAPEIIDRINRHFGYAAVTALAFEHGAPVGPPSRRRGRPLGHGSLGPAPDNPVPHAVKAAVQKAVGDVEDEDLREALQRLGEAVWARQSSV